MAQFHSFLCVFSHSVVSNPATPWTIAHQALCPWDSPGKNTGVGCYALLQGIFSTQGSNLSFPNCRQILFFIYCLSHQGSPRILEWVAYPLSRELPSRGLNPSLIHCRRLLSILWLSNIPLYICPTSSLYSPLLMGI